MLKLHVTKSLFKRLWSLTHPLKTWGMSGILARNHNSLLFFVV